MSPADIASAAEAYHRHLIMTHGTDPVRMPDLEERFSISDKPRLLNHLTWMCEQIQKQLIQKEVEKACRWLGFVQGCLYLLKEFSIEDFRKHNTVREIP